MAITPLVLRASSDSEYPSSVSVHPVAIASILDHHLRRPKTAGGVDSAGNASEQDRVIGTLMGTKSEAGEVQVLSAFGVPFGEVEGKLLLDTDSLRQQLDIVVRASPKLSVVGWYATHPDLNSWTPLIHDEYASLATTSLPAPSPLIASSSTYAPIHLTVDVKTLAVKAYASSRLGLTVDSANRTFVPLKTELKVAKGEQGGCALFFLQKSLSLRSVDREADLLYGVPTVDVLTRHSAPTIRTDSAASPATQQLVAPLVSLQGMLQEVSSMIENVLSYVRSVNEGSNAGNAKIGRYLLETLDSVPLASSLRASFDEDFNTHLADLLMVSYLANVVRVNLEVATRASMLHDARLAPRAA